jgi:hypothetical protein
MDVPLAGAEYTNQAVEVLIEKSDAPHRSFNAQNAHDFGQVVAREVGGVGIKPNLHRLIHHPRPKPKATCATKGGW